MRLAYHIVAGKGILSPLGHSDDVRAIAELLWESAGRPEGTAAEDWRRAEEIIEKAASLVVA